MWWCDEDGGLVMLIEMMIVVMAMAMVMVIMSSDCDNCWW